MARRQPRERILPLQAIVVGVVMGLVAAAVAVRLWPGADTVATEGLSLAAEELAPDLEPFEELPVRSFVLANDGTVLAVLDSGEGRDPVRLEQLPQHVIDAVLAAEDAEFFDHEGIDVDAVGRAALRTLQGDTQGGSTITQQLVKLNFVGRERTLERKFDEALLAIRLEEEYGKEELLERYLNQVYFGAGAYGITLASTTFFGVPPAELTPAQAATIAGKIRAPEDLDPWRAPELVQQRRNQVLRLMHQHGWLTDQQLEESLAAPLGVIDRFEGLPPRAAHFVEYVKREAVRLPALGETVEDRRRALYSGGLVVETTLDMEAYRHAQEVAFRTLGAPGQPAVGIASVQPGDGAIRILVGGTEFERQKFDTATQIERQPGSVFKPFVYLAALRNGISPQSVYPASSPMEFAWEDQRFVTHNYAGADYGRLTVYEGLIRSVNTVFMALGLEVGLEHVVKAIEDAGIRKGIDPFPSTSLGGVNPGVSPLEMAAAFATFAERGVYSEPYAIARVRTRAGEVLYERQQVRERRFDSRVIGALNDALLDVVARGTGRAARLQGHMVAGKTGTTSDNRDAWFVGFTRTLATAVWVGHLDFRPMPGVTGGSLPAPIWRQVMEGAMYGVEPKEIKTFDPARLGLRVLGTTTTTTTAPPEPPAEDPGPPPPGGPPPGQPPG